MPVMHRLPSLEVSSCRGSYVDSTRAGHRMTVVECAIVTPRCREASKSIYRLAPTRCSWVRAERTYSPRGKACRR